MRNAECGIAPHPGPLPIGWGEGGRSGNHFLEPEAIDEDMVVEAFLFQRGDLLLQFGQAGVALAFGTSDCGGVASSVAAGRARQS